MEQRNQEKFRHAVEHFNRGEFFASHEVLEEIWLGETREQKPFYQGLIQAAAAFHQLQRGNRAGAASLLAAGLEKLEEYPDVFQGLALAELRAGLHACLEGLSKSTKPEEVVTVTPPLIRWANSVSME